MKKFGWVFLGCGGIANTVAAELVKGSTNRITAVWNRTYSKVEEFASR